MGRIVSDAAFENPVRIFAREFLRVGTGVRMRRAVGVAFQGDRRHVDGWTFRETIFQIVINGKAAVARASAATAVRAVRPRRDATRAVCFAFWFSYS